MFWGNHGGASRIYQAKTLNLDLSKESTAQKRCTNLVVWGNMALALKPHMSVSTYLFLIPSESAQTSLRALQEGLQRRLRLARASRPLCSIRTWQCVAIVSWEHGASSSPKINAVRGRQWQWSWENRPSFLKPFHSIFPSAFQRPPESAWTSLKAFQKRLQCRARLATVSRLIFRAWGWQDNESGRWGYCIFLADTVLWRYQSGAGENWPFL